LRFLIGFFSANQCLFQSAMLMASVCIIPLKSHAVEGTESQENQMFNVANIAEAEVGEVSNEVLRSQPIDFHTFDLYSTPAPRWIEYDSSILIGLRPIHAPIPMIERAEIHSAVQPEPVLGDREARQTFRTRLVESLRRGTSNWGDSETIMRADVAAYFFDSMNNLELRYGYAVSQTEENLLAIQAMIQEIDPDCLGSDGVWRKQAAHRALDSIVSQASVLGEWLVDTSGSNLNAGFRLLNSVEVLSLVWTAQHDSSIFHTPRTQKRQKISLVNALARIQRAHNEDPLTGEIDYDPAVLDDSSCAVGTLIRLLEPLDLIHPDVQLQSHVPPAPTRATISLAQLEFVRSYNWKTPNLNAAGEHIEMDSPEFLQTEAFATFCEALRRHLVESLPGITGNQLEGSMNLETLRELIENQLSVR
jgi:hypothetical protein